MSTSPNIEAAAASGARGEIHPEVQKVLDLFDDLGVPDFYKGTPQQARRTFQGLRPDPETLPPVFDAVNRSIPVDGGVIDVRVYRPNNSARLPVMVWFHGGGWVFGDLNASELACREMCMQAGIVIVSVDYRLAPEHPFPVPLNDCIAATQWVLSNASELGVDTSRVAVGGDSAGGNLAACVAQFARDQGISLRQQILVYPVTQPSFDLQSYQDNASGYFLGRDSMRWFWDHYLADHSARNDPRASPLKGDLRSLPDAWVFTCGYDPLCDDGIAYAGALQAAGCTVASYHRDDSIHGVFGMMIEPGAEARREAAAVLARALHG